RPARARRRALPRRLALRLLGAVGEAGVAEAGADRQHAPVLHVLHARGLAQALQHGVVVHHDRRLVAVDLRDRFDQALRQVELAALPVDWKILGAALDRAILEDDAGTADADERRQAELLLA